MISIGRNIRWYNNYLDEVDFCLTHHFDFMQLWYKDGHILLDMMPEPKVKHILSAGFPTILHAVFELEDFSKYGNQLLDLACTLQHTDLIVHPVCQNSRIDKTTGHKLAEQVIRFSAEARKRNIVWYLENNSVVDGFHCQKEELEIVFKADNYVEQLLDVAHVNSYQHLQEIIDVKFPKCIHIAGKHFNIPHEHLPLAQGDIDYQLVFQRYLSNYSGKIILEVDGTNKELIQSKKIIDNAIQFI